MDLALVFGDVGQGRLFKSTELDLLVNPFLNFPVSISRIYSKLGI